MWRFNLGDVGANQSFSYFNNSATLALYHKQWIKATEYQICKHLQESIETQSDKVIKMLTVVDLSHLHSAHNLTLQCKQGNLPWTEDQMFHAWEWGFHLQRDPCRCCRHQFRHPSWKKIRSIYINLHVLQLTTRPVGGSELRVILFDFRNRQIKLPVCKLVNAYSCRFKVWKHQDLSKVCCPHGVRQFKWEQKWWLPRSEYLNQIYLHHLLCT